MLYGNDGYAVWFKLLEVLGSNSQNNYQYIAKTKEQCNKLLEKFKIDGKRLSEIINTLCELNAIDKDKWKNERILYVPNLLNNIQKMKQRVNSNTNLVEKDKTEEKNIDKKLYLEYVYLTDKQYEELVNKFGKELANDWIERCNNWIAEAPNEKKRKEKKSHYHTILNWYNRELKNTQNNNSVKKPQYRDLSNYDIN